MTKNDVLVKHLTDKYASLNQIVDAYSQEHEDRLIKGICQPKSSSLYLNIVDSLMKVVWHMKQAVDRFLEAGDACPSSRKIKMMKHIVS